MKSKREPEARNWEHILGMPKTPPFSMLHVLHVHLRRLPELLEERGRWISLYVDYHPPIVERLRRQIGDYRIFLHRIYPCARGEALYHRHPWPSAVIQLSGRYEMVLGYGSDNNPPPLATPLIIAPGTEYEMRDPDLRHSVRPVDEPTLSIMITGPLWNKNPPKKEKKKPLRKLSSLEESRLFADIKRAHAERK